MNAFIEYDPWFPAPTPVAITKLSAPTRLGAWLIAKYQRIAGERGVRHAAGLMRKQGVPIELALMALARRVTP